MKKGVFLPLSAFLKIQPNLTPAFKCQYFVNAKVNFKITLF